MKPVKEIPSLTPDFPTSTFEEAIAVKQVEGKENVYTADVKRDWCIGVGAFPFPLLPNHSPDIERHNN